MCTKLSARSVKGVFVGYNEERRAFRILPDGSNKYIVSRSVTFNETNLLYFKENSAARTGQDISDDSEAEEIMQQTDLKVESRESLISEKAEQHMQSREKKLKRLEKQLAYSAETEHDLIQTDKIETLEQVIKQYQTEFALHVQESSQKFTYVTEHDEALMGMGLAMSLGTHTTVSWEEAMGGDLFEKEEWIKQYMRRMRLFLRMNASLK